MAKLLRLAPTDQKSCMRTMELTDWRSICHPPPWIVSMVNRQLRRTLERRLQAKEAENHQVGAQEQQAPRAP